MLKIRMQRIGRINQPSYRIVVTEHTAAPQAGKFVEKLGTYNPLLEKGDEKRVTLDVERIKYWVSVGAQPSDRVARFMFDAKIGPKPVQHETPKKSAPRAKTQERMKAAAAAAEAAAGAAAEPAKEATA